MSRQGQKRIGILGGTFDPPHQGHLILAEYVYEEMGLDEIWFLPSHVPPHKKEARVSSAHRCEMVKKALETSRHLKICTVELQRSGPSYTLDTMRHLKGMYPDYLFYFIIGGDMVEYLPNWYKIDELRSLVEFTGVRRPGYQWNPAYPVHSVVIPEMDISSSLIRERAAMNKSIRYLVPDPVYFYIKEHHLYGYDS